jgi:hypothetical protein
MTDGHLPYVHDLIDLIGVLTPFLGALAAVLYGKRVLRAYRWHRHGRDRRGPPR